MNASRRQSELRLRTLSAAALITAALAGCHRDMYDQPRYEPLEPSQFFDDGRSSRPLVDGVVVYGAPPADSVMQTGRENGELTTELPVKLDRAVLRRGRERFNIFCSNCHGATGDGNGMIVQRGYRQPPTYHSDRLRGAPIGHFFDVATNGFGVMPAYAIQISVEDRWAIAAYIRALQLSQHATLEDAPAAARGQLEELETGAAP